MVMGMLRVPASRGRLNPPDGGQSQILLACIRLVTWRRVPDRARWKSLGHFGLYTKISTVMPGSISFWASSPKSLFEMLQDASFWRSDQTSMS